MTITQLFKALCAGAVVWGIAASAVAADDPLGVARKHLADKNAKAAYEVLAPLQGERAGDPAYDYLLGISALDSGRLTEAVFAFERVLAVQPDNAQARAEIARAYFLLGEREAAKGEFESVSRAEVPAEARATVRQYLEAISRADAEEGTKFRAYVDVTVGYDSNVNSGPGDSDVAIPGFGVVVTLDPRSRDRDDAFGTLATGASVTHRFNPTWSLFAGANVNRRFNSAASEFDVGGWDINIGVAARDGRNNYSLAYQSSDLYVENDRYRDINGGVLQWQHDLDTATQVSAFVQYASLHYPGQSFRDTDRTVFGVAMAHAYAAKYNPVVFGSAYMGSEDEQENPFPYVGHRLLGFRVGTEISLRSDLKGFGGFGYEYRKYNGPDPILGSVRKDRQFDVRVGATYVPARFWSVIPQYSYTNNDSKLVFNDFDRHIFSVTLRREFE